MLTEKLVQFLDDLARVMRLRNTLADEAVHTGHQQGRGDAVRGHVADADVELAFAGREHRGVVPADMVRRPDAREDVHAIQGHAARQKAEKHLLRESQVAIDCLDR